MSKRSFPVVCAVALVLVIVACGSSTGGQVEAESDPVAAVEVQSSIDEPATETAVEATIEDFDDVLFGTVRQELTDGSTIPVRLPTDIVRDFPLYASVSIIDADNYAIQVSFEPECSDPSCQFGRLSGRRLRADEPDLSAGVALPLPNGLIGEFYDVDCRVNCNDPFITWIEDGVSYSFGGSATSPELLTWAWSAIDPSLTPPEPPDGPLTCDGGLELANGDAILVVEDDEFANLHWLIQCRSSGVVTDVVDGPAELRLLEPGVSELFAFQFDDGRVQLGLGQELLIDRPGEPDESFRLEIGDLRCDRTDGRITLVADADTGTVWDVVDRPGWRTDNEGATDIASLDRC